MSKFLVCMDIDQPMVASIKYDEKSALASLAFRKEAGFPNCIAKEFAYKPEPKDVGVSWCMYYTFDGVEYCEEFRTRELARNEKKFLLANLAMYPNKPTNIYITREEVWVVDKKKVS